MLILYSFIRYVVQQFFYLIQMSFFIQQLNSLHRRYSLSEDKSTLAHTHHQLPLSSISIIEQSKENSENNEKIEWKGVQHYFISSNAKITILKHIRYNQLTSHLIYTAKLISNQLKLIQTMNRERRLFYFKAISQRIMNKTAQNIVFTFHPYSGYLKIVLFNGSMFGRKMEIDYLNHIMQKYYNFDQFKDYILLILSGTYINRDTISLQAFPINANYRNILNAIPKMAVGLIVNSSSKAESTILQGFAAQRAKQQNLIANLVEVTQSELIQLGLYTPFPVRVNRLQFFFNDLELSQISTKIRTPTVVKCKNLFENNCILNYIQINHSQRLRLTKINSGGFSSIFVTQIQYWYVFSGSQNQVISPLPQATFNRDNMFKKVVIFKKDQNNGGSSRSRVAHQKQILKKMKNGSAIFLPKYYISLNESAINKTLFCDYIPSPNLAEYLYLHRETLSLSSKFFILVMLIQGIRFLSGYGVYHLDIKPQNVMVTKSMMIKLIDFGQSYHHQVVGQDFVPGFTMPYSSPECYYPIDLSVFSARNDIFSLGVIAHEMLNNRLPFYFYDEDKHFDRYIETNFQDFWMYAPEESQDRSDPFMFRFIQLVIGRCMDVRAQRRPDLQWLCFIFREFLDFYY